jgi:hypothetical protein
MVMSGENSKDWHAVAVMSSAHRAFRSKGDRCELQQHSKREEGASVLQRLGSYW